MLDIHDADRLQHGDVFGPYVREQADHSAHRVKGFAATVAELQPAGQALYQLLQVMAADYGLAPACQVAARLFRKEYQLVADAAEARVNHEISASGLQSLNDLEAVYRAENRVGYKGYVASVTEACDRPARTPLLSWRSTFGVPAPQFGRLTFSWGTL